MKKKELMTIAPPKLTSYLMKAAKKRRTGETAALESG